MLLKSILRTQDRLVSERKARQQRRFEEEPLDGLAVMTSLLPCPNLRCGDTMRRSAMPDSWLRRPSVPDLSGPSGSRRQPVFWLAVPAGCAHRVRLVRSSSIARNYEEIKQKTLVKTSGGVFFAE